MKVDLIRKTTFPNELCGEAAAICTDSKNTESALKHAMESGHTSVLEHAVYTFRVEGISRACLAQLTRHRIASFDVQSQRYVDMGDMPVVVPASIHRNKPVMDRYTELMEEIKAFYKDAVMKGVPKEDARYITPQAAQTTLIMTMNARELLHFFSLRTCNRAQWEIRNLADKMLKLCKESTPIIFINAGPGCVTGHCPEKKPCGHPRCTVDWEEVTE